MTTMLCTIKKVFLRQLLKQNVSRLFHGDGKNRKFPNAMTTHASATDASGVLGTKVAESQSNSYQDQCPPGQHRATVLENHGYTLGRTIGTGSYATVKVARSERHDCYVAVKIVSKFQAPTDYLRKFLPREIEVVKGLRHPNLIRFLQAIETTHRVYIIMEYAQNGSLLDIIRHDSHIDEPRAKKWFRQLVEAVQYCHERGVVHRDIKCENLLMDANYNIKISDFGFARGNMHPKNGGSPILSETFCGSYAYASPEILRGIPYQPQLSDIWSMGVVLYATVFGRLPFDDTNYNQLLKQVQSKLTFPKEPKVSIQCKTLIQRILSPVRSRVRLPAIVSDPWLGHSSSDVPVKANAAGATELKELDENMAKKTSQEQFADPDNAKSSRRNSLRTSGQT